jgi:hypothetical protein
MSPTSHLDDDRLSALLDGEAGAVDVQHADGCPDCRRRVAAWRATTATLAVQPEPVAAVQRQAAVEAAVKAAAEAGLAAVEPARTPPPDQPIPLVDHRRRWAAFSWTRSAAAVAAVVLVAGIAVAISHIGDGGPNPSSTAAGVTRPPAGSQAGPAAGTAGQSSASAAPVVNVALGSFQNPAGVVAALQVQLGQLGSTSTAPSAQRSASPSTAGPPPEAAGVPPPCQAPAVSGAKATPQSIPVLDATLTYRGSPARAYVFMVADRHAVAVVGVPGCRLLAVATF